MALGRHLVAMLLLGASFPRSVLGQADVSGRVPAPEPVYLLIRSDDAGMTHSVNMALQRLMNTGLPVSVSVMFACPWYQETVEILKRHPAVAVGIHLTLNSEWKNYRWGPVTGREAVPTLVDADGYFFPSTDDLYRNHTDMKQVEKELRAQIARALRSGLKIDYVDYHMGTAVGAPEFRALVERLAREYGFGMSGYFGETIDDPQYRAARPAKVDSLVVIIDRLQPGVNVVVTHVGLDNAELGALEDMNTGEPLANMSANRQGELDALTSNRFTEAVKARNVVLTTYRELIAKQGLTAMRR